jgi:hypothetical protein
VPQESGSTQGETMCVVVRVHGLQVRSFESPVGIFDCAWNERNPNQVTSGRLNRRAQGVELWRVRCFRS